MFVTGSEGARLLISTDAAVMVSDLDGLNPMHISENEEITRSTKESNGKEIRNFSGHCNILYQ